MFNYELMNTKVFIKAKGRIYEHPFANHLKDYVKEGLNKWGFFHVEEDDTLFILEEKLCDILGEIDFSSTRYTANATEK